MATVRGFKGSGFKGYISSDPGISNSIQWEFMKFERAPRNCEISFVPTNRNGSIVGDDICVSKGDNHACISLSNKNGLTLNL